MGDAPAPVPVRAKVAVLCASCLWIAPATACVGTPSGTRSPVAAADHAGAEAAPPVLRRGTTRLGTWVWRKRTVLDADERQTLLEFAHEESVTELYVAVADDYETPDGLAALADLVGRAGASHIEVHWVSGDPSWALSSHHDRALAVVDWAVRVNTLLQARGLGAIRALQYDVEPYLLPEWKASPGAVEPEYASLLAKIRSATQKAGFELWLDVPFWFEQPMFRDTPLGRFAVRSSDGIVIMAYRSTAAGVAEKASELLHDPEARPRSVVVALETSCGEPPPTTMCGASAAAIDSALGEIRDRLGGVEAFGGLAVHHYDPWRDLPRGR
jgi:hypothetical protein